MEYNLLKTTNALYKILDFLPDNDPLKNKAKEKALAILEHKNLADNAQDWILLKDLLSTERQKASFQLLHDTEILLQYLDIGKNLGWIDAMNFLIITKEYNLVAASLRKEISNNVKIQNLNSEHRDQKDENSRSSAIDSNSRELASNLVPLTGYSKRQGRILQILGQKTKAQVSDFIREIPNVTKRTLRRDLDDLLKKGMVIRAGDWNKVFYQLSHPIYQEIS